MLAAHFNYCFIFNIFLSMIRIGIVGALSPLGKEVLKILTGTSDYDVIWTVDEHYATDDPQKFQFKNFETPWLCDLRPELILDFASHASTSQRVKIYRSNGIPAIMQGMLSKGEIDALREITMNGICTPIIIEPDFSTVITQAVKNLLCQTHHLMDAVQSVRVDIRHNSSVDFVRLPWIHWANMLNSVVGDNTEFPTGDGAKISFGHVNVHNHHAAELAPDEEIINIELILDAPKGSLIWNIACPLLQSRIEGVLLLLDWYVSQREISQDWVLGEISEDMLPMLL